MFPCFFGGRDFERIVDVEDCGYNASSEITDASRVVREFRHGKVLELHSSVATIPEEGLPVAQKKGKKPIIVFEYERSPEYRDHYVNGARGSIQNGYNVHLEFYKEKQKLSTKQHLMQGDTEVERKIIDVDAPKVPVITRQYIVGIDLSFHAARELTDFLVKRMKEIDAVEVQLAEARKKEEA